MKNRSETILSIVNEGDVFLANMGHELRSPLTSILAISEALHDGVYGSLNEAQERSLLSIKECAESQIELIMDMVDLSRLETGPLQMIPTACPLEDLVERALAIVRELARARSVRLSSDISPKGGTVMGDARRLRQMIIHLIIGGICAAPEEGQVRAFVSQSADHASLLIQVVSSPPGIAVSLPDISLCDEGTAADALKRAGQGRPAGLTLLQQIVRLHRGALVARETLDGGVFLCVSLPWSMAPLETVPPPSSAQECQHTAAAAPLILLVDDQAALVAIISDYLSHQGFDVRTAASGREAVDLAEALQPDLVIMDVQMPGMDGLEATGHIRKSGNPKVATVPVISLSGLGGPGDRERCLAAGASTFLAKPFGVKELEAVILGIVRQPSPHAA